MRDTPFQREDELAAYVAGQLIQCLECGRWFRALATHLPRAHGMTHAQYRERWGIPARIALAGRGTRALLSDQMRELIASGSLTHDHLPAATASARKTGRRRKAPVDAAAQRHRVASARPGDHSKLPAGAKRADGRDADRARKYQIAYRAAKRGAPEPMARYRQKRKAKP